MVKKAIYFLALLQAIAYGRNAFAFDIYSFISNSCEVQSGLIVGADEGVIHVINLNGNFVSVDRSNISTIVLFNTLENPIPEINMTNESAAFAKEIYVREDDKPLFVGWPVRFVEELVIFYDTLGKTHVLDLAEVTKIRDIHISSTEVLKITKPAKVDLNFNSVNSHCANLNSPVKDGVGPTRIIDDKINISEFLANFEKGFQKIESYQERTYFYARPFLFEPRSKLGLVVFNQYQENSPLLPVYFQWSTGKPYGFQTFNVFGSAPVEWLPLAEPTFAIRSDVKSHFFNGTFVGNIAALPAGSSYYANLGITQFPKNEFAAHQFNYLTLLGADYGPFSLSIGTFFPIFNFFVKTGTSTESREVLANALSPAFRVMYSKGPLTLRVIYSATQESGSGSDNNNLRYTTGLGSAPTNYSLAAAYVRGGVDYIFTKELKAGIDEIYSFANYTENFGNSQFFFNSSHLTTSAYFLQSFGYYISAKVLINVFDDSINFNFPNETGSPSPSITSSIGGVFEFDF